MDDLNARAAAVFGGAKHFPRWPYDVTGIDYLLREKDPERFRRDLAVLTTKRYAIVEWAELYSLKKSSVKCCPLWLTHRTSRRCAWDSDCQSGGHPDRSWLDHAICWLRNGRPAVITSAPYEVSDKDQQRHLWWRKAHPTLRVQQGAGWYGHGTTQIVMWNTTRIEHVAPASNIDDPRTFMHQS
ncbi:hypothetical protein ABZ694_25160 [Streptomyces albidoflavus]|uniref:hypothetical protein n=1 Tax=Streptomyces albidoflavus TaxID=1886 RepID=UPI0033F7B08B